jgi:hypothetical protein
VQLSKARHAWQSESGYVPVFDHPGEYFKTSFIEYRMPDIRVIVA